MSTDNSEGNESAVNEAVDRRSKHDNEESGTKQVDREIKNLRKLLQLYFHPAFRFKDGTCTVHVLYCILFLVHTVELSLITVQFCSILSINISFETSFQDVSNNISPDRIWTRMERDIANSRINMFSFGKDREHFSSIVNRGHITLQNLLLQGWDASWETLPYPPAHGDFATYSKKDIIHRINFAVERYLNIETEAIGFYTRIPSDDMYVQLKYYNFEQCNRNCTDDDRKLAIQDTTFKIDTGINLMFNSSSNTTRYKYDIMKDFAQHNISNPIKRLLSLKLKFSIHSVRIFLHENQALCLSIAGAIHFSDLDDNGQVIVSLDSTSNKIKCTELDLQITDWSLQRVSMGLALAVIITCCVGLICTIKVNVFAFFVMMKTKMFMREFYQVYFEPDDPTETDLPIGEYFRFVSFWDMFVMLAELLTIYGTMNIILKDERRSIDLYELDFFTILLAVGCFFAWFSILRFIRFHDKFRLLFNTVWLALNDVIAYLLCVGIMFSGYFVVGYVVLGPYNVKFRTPYQTCETLAALVNGDEIYATFGIMECEDYGMIWWFARIYLYTYIATFTIVVLNLLVAIFMSAYEAIKEKNSKKKSDSVVGEIENAFKDFLENHTKNEFRNSLRELMTSSHHFDSVEERTLRTHLSKICRVSENGEDVVLRRSRTLKELMKEGSSSKQYSCCGVDVSIISFWQLSAGDKDEKINV